MKRLFAALIFILLAAPAVAQDFDKGLAAYNSGDYATALREMRPLAEQGWAPAQNNLGLMYKNGRGVPQDYAKAMKWYRLAAEQGNAAAQNNLGVMYGRGQGVPQNYVQAHMWFNLAAVKSGNDSVKNRDNIAERMTPADISKAQGMAREWLEAHPR